MKKMIDRWRKMSFYKVANRLKIWMNAAKIDEKKAVLKKKEMEYNDTEF